MRTAFPGPFGLGTHGDRPSRGAQPAIAHVSPCIATPHTIYHGRYIAARCLREGAIVGTPPPLLFPRQKEKATNQRCGCRISQPPRLLGKKRENLTRLVRTLTCYVTFGRLSVGTRGLGWKPRLRRLLRSARLVTWIRDEFSRHVCLLKHKEPSCLGFVFM